MGDGLTFVFAGSGFEMEGDGLLADAEVARGSEDVGEKLLGLGGLLHVLGQLGGEVGLGIEGGDADRI